MKRRNKIPVHWIKLLKMRITMKIKLIQILVVNLVLGFLALGFGARAWAGSNPNAQSMSVVPEIISPTPTHLKRNVKKIKSAGGTESAANLEPTSSDTEVPTPIAISAHHAHHSKKVKLSSDADLSTETVENGLVPQTTSVATTVAPLQASATAIPDYEFNAVVVTGTKTKLKVLDSPAAVSVVPKSKIDQKSVVYFDDALTDLPGVQVSRTSKGGQSVTLTMRGIPGYDKNLVLLDGFTLNQPVNMRVFWNRVPTQLVDHVEIVRGPFSALYGKSALGGVVNIITKEPEGESFNLSENWDSTNTRVTNVNYQNKISDAFSFYLGAEDTTVNRVLSPPER
jgi:outer membrane receptor for monomeric catechols